MKLAVEQRALNGLVVLRPECRGDERGFFFESFRKDVFEELGLPGTFVQDNHSRSAKGVIRGMHFQWEPPQAKLVRVTVGEALAVAVDIRKGSPTAGKWFSCILSAENKLQLWEPAGFANGFCALSEFVEMQYKCSAIYNPACESGIRWNDPALGIDWKIDNPVLSEKDATAQSLEEWFRRPESDFFTYKG